jgi:plasmid maintenance system antidote protein VapI
MDYRIKLLKTIKESGLSQTAFARLIGYSRINLNKIINGTRRFTLILAVRLEKAGFGNADEWAKLLINELRN